METPAQQVEVLSAATNASILRMPGRRFPGVLVQGDSLSILLDEALDVLAALSDKPDSEAFDAALNLAETLESLLAHYETTLNQKGLELPYSPNPDRTTKRVARRPN